MKSIGISLLFLLCLSVNAQTGKKITLSSVGKSTAKLTRGPENDGKRSMIERVLGSTSKGVIIHRFEKRDQFLELIGLKGETLASRDITDLKDGKSEKSLLDGMVINGRLFLRFITKESRKSGKMIIDEYDVNTLKFVRKVQAETHDENSQWFIYYNKKEASSGFIYSRNKTSLLEYFDEKGEKDEPETYSIKVYNSELKSVWKKSLKLPYNREMFIVKKVIVDDSANVHFLGIEYIQKPTMFKNALYKYHVISYDKTGKKIKDNVIKLPGKFIASCTITISAEGHLVVAGFYGKDEKYGLDGVFSALFDVETQEILSTGHKEFDTEFIKEGLTERQQKKIDRKEAKGKDVSLPEFRFDELIETPDGGMILLAENFYITTYTTTTTTGKFTTTTRHTVYHYDDIIAVKIGTDSKIQWNIKVVKEQNAEGNLSRLSYAWGSCDNGLGIIYNTAPGSKSNKVMLTMVDAGGKVTDKMLMNDENEELDFRPKFSEMTKDCQMLLFSSTRKIYQFNLLDLVL